MKHTPDAKSVWSWRDALLSTLILVLATGIGTVFSKLGFTEANIIMVYILGVLIISVVVKNRIYSLISSLVSVLVFNFFFTVPKFTFLAYHQGYPVTFLIMFIAAFLTSTLAGQLKNHAKQAAQAAYRTQILLDTNQLLQKAAEEEAVFTATANQLQKLLGREVALREKEQASVLRADCLYYPVSVNENRYGVAEISDKEHPPDAFEEGIVLSILGECALALENLRNVREKEEAKILAQNEQLRANLLRTISHDLRTPLTSISGHASNLLTNGEEFDEKTKNQMYEDIYDDSMWLITLVENLLSVTRIEDGRMQLHPAPELMDEVVSEALQHVDRKSTEHRVTVKNSEEFLLARIDAKLIVQVLINLVDNAVKYTPEGSTIEIETKRQGNQVVVCVRDDGPGISDEIKPHIFEMFYRGTNKPADSRRSLGLGLYLCKSIINAHGGTIEVSDHIPHGTCFTFFLPAEEVSLHE